VPRAFRLLLLSLLLLCAKPGLAQPNCVVSAELDGIVNRGTASYLGAAIQRAEEQGCSAVIVRIDTPGGVLDPTRDIVRMFLGAKVPVLALVAPSGARAGSAGMFITIAAHIAAMAPGSNIGAAHPVLGGGKDPDTAGKELAKKVENDAAAMARAIAEQRGRNVEWAEAAVRESASITASEALEKKVIDLLASNRAELLEAVHGRTVRVANRDVTLATRGATVEVFKMTIQQRALRTLGHPNIAYFLMMIGMLGLMFEFYNPGMLIPAGIGLFCLLLAAIGLDILPVNVGGIVLIALAVGLFIAEVFVTSYGLLSAGGVASLLLGTALLLDRSDPDFWTDANVSISWGLVIPLTALLASASGLLAYRARTNERRPVSTGREGLIGALGRSLGPIGPDAGSVFVKGERWRAVSDTRIAPDERVRVIGVKGLLLTVEAAPEVNEPLKE
jgi:membrane-bound serine protease (ClpP class)